MPIDLETFSSKKPPAETRCEVESCGISPKVAKTRELTNGSLETRSNGPKVFEIDAGRVRNVFGCENEGLSGGNG